MKRLSKISAVLLLASIVAVPATASLSLGMASIAPAAGCHQHGKTPQPEPVSHICCQIGHRVAILREPAPVGPLVVTGLPMVPCLAAPSPPVLLFDAPVLKLSSAPPGAAPLRI